MGIMREVDVKGTEIFSTKKVKIGCHIGLDKAEIYSIIKLYE